MKDYHMERSDVSSCGFGNKPDIKTRSSSDHHFRLQNVCINCCQKFVTNKLYPKLLILR